MRTGSTGQVRWWRHGGALAITMALFATACTSSGDSALDRTGGTTPPTVDIGDVDLIAALQRYDSCDAFLDDVKAQALERVGPYGLGGGGGWGWPMPGAARIMNGAEELDMATADDMAGPATGSVGAGEPAFSGTNVQEQGVDEPDLVKTDGRIVAVVNQSTLHVLDVSDPTEPVSLSSTPLAGYQAELLMHRDRLLVFQRVGQYWEPATILEDAIGAPVGSAAPSDPVGDDMPSGRIAPGPWWPNNPLTTVTQLDISNPASPRVERTWTVEGDYVSARLVDGVARIVLRSDPSASLPFVYPGGPGSDESATEANRSVIRNSTIDDWVSTLTVADGNGNVTAESTVAPCDQLYRPTTFSGFGLVSVLTADLGGSGLGDGDGDGVGVLSSGETVYASPTSLFVATIKWEQPEALASGDDIMPVPSSGSERTDVHQFSIEGTGAARYLASGSVDGRILNQFSMSEHDGHLRIAVTEGNWDPQSASSVIVLSREGDRLEAVGSIGDLGLGERIYAVRFMGDRGYVVTFREIDPLYTLDLSDPRNPQMLGELKIPGFSSYLHPVGDDMLIGIGQNATDEGRVLGSQVSLFDVSNPADPQRVAQLDLGEGTNSEVEYDHRAFLFWNDLAVLPFTSYRWDSTSDSMSTGAIGVDIDVASPTLSERGRISHGDQPSGAVGAPSGTSLDWDRQYQSQIRRSFVIDDTLFTVSDRGLLGSDLTTLEPGTWLGFGG